MFLYLASVNRVPCLMSKPQIRLGGRGEAELIDDVY